MVATSIFESSRLVVLYVVALGVGRRLGGRFHVSAGISSSRETEIAGALIAHKLNAEIMLRLTSL